MKKLSIVLALLVVVAMAIPAVAEVEEVTVGGSIQVRGNYQTPGISHFSEEMVPTDVVAQQISLSLFPVSFNDDVPALDYWTQRTRVNVDAKLSGGIRAFVEIQSYDFWGVDVDDIDVEAASMNTTMPILDQRAFGVFAGQGDDWVQMYQAYIEMNNICDYPLSLRVGRQEIVLGREWLVGNNSAGVNFSGFALDGIRASYDTDLFRVDAWWTQLIDGASPEARLVNDKADTNVDFSGVYGTYKGIENMAIDAYFLWVRNPITTLSITPTDESTNNLYTVGARVAGQWDFAGMLPGMLDYNIEGAAQFGDNNGVDLEEGDFDDSGSYEGWAFNAMAGYTFSDVTWTPRLELEYAFFSGDSDIEDGDTGEFVRLFSDVHYGELNLGGNFDNGATNMHIIRVGASAVPVEKLTVKGDLYWFLLAESDDESLGKTFGVPQVFADDSFDDSPGLELDLVADYQYTEDLNLRAGWAHFFADDAIKNSWGRGQDDDVDYLYVQALLVF